MEKKAGIMKHISKFIVIGMLAPTVYAAGGSEKMDVTSRIYGHINRLGMYTNDGYQKNWLFSDNDHDSTKLGADVQINLNHSIAVGAQLETWLAKSKGYYTSQINRNGEIFYEKMNFVNIQYSNVWLKHKQYGTVAVGILPIASDGAGEISMANTYNIAYVGVADMAPGMIFHNKVSNQAVTFVGDLSDVYDNFGSINFGAVTENGRKAGNKSGIKYISPKLFGSVNIAGSYGNFDFGRDYTDVSIWFDRQFPIFSVKAAGAMGKTSHGDKQQSRKFFNMSAGLLHDVSGWNLSGSWGKEKNDLTGTYRRADPPVDTKNHVIRYVQLGKRNDFFQLGSTNFAVDYYKGKNSSYLDDKSKSYGFVVEQQVDKIAGAIFAGIRKYDYQTTAIKYDKITVIAFGVKVGFEVKSS